MITDASTTDWPVLAQALKPGQHAVILRANLLCGFYARAVGLEFRDTLMNVTPNGAEAIFLFRKPLDGTVANSVLTHETGALNIGRCRIDYTSTTDEQANQSRPARGHGNGNHAADLPHLSPDWGAWQGGKGRWPTNLVFTHAPGCKRVGVKEVPSGSHWTNKRPPNAIFKIPNTNPVDRGNLLGEGGTETTAAWSCATGCPVKALDEMSGETTNTRHMSYQRSGKGFIDSIADAPERRWWTQETGTASRFFPQFRSRDELLAWLETLTG